MTTTKLQKLLSAGAIALGVTVSSIALPMPEARAEAPEVLAYETEDEGFDWGWLGLLGLLGLAGLAGRSGRHHDTTTTTTYRDPAATGYRDPDRTNY